MFLPRPPKTNRAQGVENWAETTFESPGRVIFMTTGERFGRPWKNTTPRFRVGQWRQEDVNFEDEYILDQPPFA